jgi:hypothetical protein
MVMQHVSFSALRRICSLFAELMGNLILPQIQTKRNFSRKFSTDIRGASTIDDIVE